MGTAGIEDCLGNYGVQEWFAIAFSCGHFTFVLSLFLVFSSTSMREFFLSFTVSFKVSKRRPVLSLMLST